jgi:UDP-glucose 4-epimerase
MRYVITGCAGFIGSNLADRLLQQGHEVVGFDNFSTGFHEFLTSAKASPKFSMIVGDLLDKEKITEAMKGADAVFHMAANADIRFGTERPYKDLEQNVLATFNVLEAMRAHQVKRIAFASSSAIYGDVTVFPTPEAVAIPVQSSLYGASKLSAEALIQAYCEGFGFQSHIFRFVSFLGNRYTHGHVFDFYKQLLQDPTRLHILGNGKQRKSYLSVDDGVDAILTAFEHAKEKVNVFNLGSPNYCEVNDSVGWICEHLGLNPTLTYSGGDRGWVGDIPFIFLDCTRIRQLGWQPKYTIQQSIIQTVDYLKANTWLFERR